MSAVDPGLMASGRALASEVAGAMGEEVSEVFEALTYVPSNMLALLESPQGWAVLAQYLASGFGGEVADYSPTVH